MLRTSTSHNIVAYYQPSSSHLCLGSSAHSHTTTGPGRRTRELGITTPLQVHRATRWSLTYVAVVTDRPSYYGRETTAGPHRRRTGCSSYPLGLGLGLGLARRRPTAPLDRRRPTAPLARRRPATKSVERGRGHSTRRGGRISARSARHNAVEVFVWEVAKPQRRCYTPTPPPLSRSGGEIAAPGNPLRGPLFFCSIVVHATRALSYSTFEAPKPEQTYFTQRPLVPTLLDNPASR